MSSEPLDRLLLDGVVDRVVGGLKSGKEADIYLVEHAGQIVAAKVYKERHQRSFRHNAGYKEGRQVRNSRTQRAIDKGTRFGQAAAEEAWKAAEADALYKLHAQGVRVPTPVMFYEGVLLMELVVDGEGRPAKRLVDTPLGAQQAGEIYVDLLGQVVRMLCAELIHGDLSGYNVLMGVQGPTVIDFPQVVGAAHNNRAEQLLRRDVENLRRFLGGFERGLLGRSGDAGAIWRAYARRELTPDFLPTGREVEPPRASPAHGGRPQSGQAHGRHGRHGGGRGHHGPPQAGSGHGNGTPQGAPRPLQGGGGPVISYVNRPGSSPPSPNHPGGGGRGHRGRGR